MHPRALIPSIFLVLGCSATDGGSPSQAASGGGGATSSGGSGATGTGGSIAVGGSGGGGSVPGACTPSTEGTLGVDCASTGVQLLPPYDKSYTCLDLGVDANIPPKW